jgi:restriction system protein
MKIYEAAMEVLKDKPQGLTMKEILSEIVARNLYVFKAITPLSALNPEVRRHCFGLDFPTASPVKYFTCEVCGKTTYYKNYDENSEPSYETETDKSERENNELDDEEKDFLPEEAILVAHKKHISDVKQILLGAVLDKEKSIKQKSAFFEKLVVELIIKMGYGYDAKSGVVSGRSHDGGIDGIVSEDRLGLDKIYIQAKCYDGNIISRPAVQSFVGAMENVQKGVFITTSSFSKSAKEYANKGQHNKTIRLIDGEELTNSMVRYKVGVQVIDSVSIYKIDEDYFIG